MGKCVCGFWKKHCDDVGGCCGKCTHEAEDISYGFGVMKRKKLKEEKEVLKKMKKISQITKSYSTREKAIFLSGYILALEDLQEKT